MAKQVIESCDICGKVRRYSTPNYTGDHWSTWGSLKLGFKAHPSVQADIEFDLICDTCCGKIKESIMKTWTDLDPKAQKG